MKTSSGNLAPRPPGDAQTPEVRPPAPGPRPERRAEYRKPALRRLGLLRSVTGSNLKW